MLRAEQLILRAEGLVSVAKQGRFKSLGQKLGLDVGSLVHLSISEGVAGICT